MRREVIEQTFMSIFNPTRPAEAFDRFLAEDAQTSRKQPVWEENDGAMPALYLSHGAPPVFDDPHWMGQMFAWSKTSPAPQTIVIVGAHWEPPPPSPSYPEPATIRD